MKTALVTGASRGLGYCIVKELLSQNWSVVAHVRDATSAQQLASRLKGNSANLSFVTADLRDMLQVADLVETVKREKKSLDVLFNNAAIFSHQDDASLFSSQACFLNDCLTINLHVPIFLAQSLYGLMMESTDPLVVNILSDLSAPQTMDGAFPIYRSTKAGLMAFTLNHVSQKCKMKIIGIDPGWMQTDMGGQSAPDTPEIVSRDLINVVNDPAKIVSGAIYCNGKQKLFWQS